MKGILCFVYLIEAIEKFYFLKGALGFHELWPSLHLSRHRENEWEILLHAVEPWKQQDVVGFIFHKVERFGCFAVLTLH